MRVFVETSILIPLFYGDHPHHQASTQAISRLEAQTGFCSAHGLVETYSTLTRMPGNYRASAEQARLFVAGMRERLQVVALTEGEYWDLIDECAAIGLVGGSVYDAVHERCAMKVGAEVLLTWNHRDFLRFGEAISGLVKSPLEFTL